MCQAHTGNGRHIVHDEDALDIVHNDPPTSTYQFLLQQAFLTPQYGIHCVTHTMLTHLI
jgi:hypothetical protein